MRGFGMISVAAKLAMTRASGIWLIVTGAAIIVFGLFNFGAFMVSWGFEEGPVDTSTSSLMFTPAVIPGLLYLFAGWSLLVKNKWWLAFICLIVLCAACVLLGFAGVSWYLAGAVILGSLAAAVLLLISKRIFD
jgi:hypothetical protein